MDTQLPELFPKLSILPPLSITGVECPEPISYNHEKGSQIRPPASLHSVPFHSFRKLPMLRKGRTMRKEFQGTAFRFAPVGCLRRLCNSASLRLLRHFGSLPPHKVLAPLRSSRVHFPPSLPKRLPLAAAFPPLGFACRSASLRFTLHN